jgi:hypothetical protein
MKAGMVRCPFDSRQWRATGCREAGVKRRKEGLRWMSDWR